jgi:hypothetical protein
MRIITKGATSKSIYVIILDSTSTTGGRKTGLVYNSSGLLAYYTLNQAAAVAITLATLAAANSAYSSGGFKEVDATNHPGLYRLDLPNAALTGADSCVVTLRGVTGMVQVDEEIQLTAVDLQDAVRGGMTSQPNANAGAAGGLPILGANATAISFTGGLTISNAAGDALTLSSGGSNGNGLAASGNGSGAGIKGTGGTTGNGVQAVGGATSGAGVKSVGTAGNSAAMELAGQGSAAGLLATGGATGEGLKAVGGATSGSGFKGVGTAGNAAGIEGAGQGSAAGLLATGGATGEGIKGVGGATSGSGIKALGSAGNAIGMEAAGQGSAAGLQAAGGATGPGLKAVGGATSGDGILANTTSGHGMNLAPTGASKHGLLATGGNSGTSDGIKGAAGTGGTDIRGNIIGDITGNISKIKKYIQLFLRKDAAIATDNATELTELNANGGTGGGTFDNTEDALEAQKDAGASTDDLGILLNTTIATLASQTSFTGTVGSANDNAYNGCLVVVRNASTATQKALGVCATYTGATKTFTLQEDPGIFTMAVGDYITVLVGAVAVFKRRVDGTTTFEQGQRLQNSAAAGKLSGGATTTVAVRDLADTKDRISATVDANGNRSAVTLNVT